MKKLIRMFFAVTFLMSVGLPACADKAEEFIQAARNGEMNVVKKLVKKVDEKVKEEALCAALESHTVEDRHWDIASFLLDNGTNPNIRCGGYDYESNYTLVMGTMNGYFRDGYRGGPYEVDISEVPLRTEVLRKAIKNGANVDEKVLVTTDREDTALTLAIRGGDHARNALIKILVSEGKPDLFLTCNGQTPVEVAADYHKWEIVEFLETEMNKQRRTEDN